MGGTFVPSMSKLVNPAAPRSGQSVYFQLESSVVSLTVEIEGNRLYRYKNKRYFISFHKLIDIQEIVFDLEKHFIKLLRKGRKSGKKIHEAKKRFKSLFLI